MHTPRTLTNAQLIGRRIRAVYERDLEYVKKYRFQPRLIIVELTCGFQFFLHQYPDTPESQLKNKDICQTDKMVLDADIKPELSSPIKEVVRPYDAPYDIGWLLENGYALHNGFSEWDNSVDFYLADEADMRELKSVELPLESSEPGN